MQTGQVYSPGQTSDVTDPREEVIAQRQRRQPIRFLQSFSDRWGKLPGGELKKHNLQTWLTENQQKGHNGRRHTGWDSASCRTAIASVSVAFNWAADMGLISKNPIARFKRPAPKSRSAYCVVSDEQHALLLAEANRRSAKGFANLLTVLYETGARPGEVRLLEASHYNPDLQAFIIDTEDGGNNKLVHTGRRRVIYLTPRLIPLVEELIKAYPQGPLLSNEFREFFPASLLPTL
jgi:integrase